MVTNVGNRPGVIGNGYVKFTVTDELSGLDEAWMVSTNPQIVQPNGTAIISQTLDHSFLQNIWRAIDHAEKRSPGHRLIKSDDQRAGWIGVTVTLPSKDYRGQRSNTVWNGYLECIQDSCLFSSTKLDFDVADLNAATNRSPTAVARDWHPPEWRDGAVRASPSEW
ncbi:hypothetical protein U1839_23110 [Sphingomonas sp. RT2P30]|uniref:hypothetical protein n=1 Tax=Parasphingomonas halimpatiens TaxID=3096162 RepID=UPI002FC9AF5E